LPYYQVLHEGNFILHLAKHLSQVATGNFIIGDDCRKTP